MIIIIPRAKTMYLHDLKVNRFNEPTGIDLSLPVFSFCVDGEGAGRLSAVRITVSEREDMKNPVYDSGERSDISPIGFVPEIKFEGGKKYFWRAEVFNDNGESARAVSFFEGGRKSAEWDVPFITTAEDNRRAAAFYRAFALSERDFSGARLYITGLGLYEAYINGKKVGDEYFTPFYDDYRYSLQYQTYDVSAFLREGENEITVLLGNGWHGGRYPAGKNGDGMFGDGFRLSAELVLSGEKADGVAVLTDEKWRELESPIIFSEIYDGEIYDAGKELFDDDGKVAEKAKNTAKPVKISSAPSAEIIPRISPAVCERENFFPALIKTPGGETVLDFGQEITGWVEFVCDLKAGERIKLSYGEALQNGCFYRDNLRTAKAEFIYISDGKRRVVRPHFTFYGFRYVKAEGLSDIELKLQNFTAKAIYSEMPRRGFIHTSDGTLDKFIENTLWGQKGNFLDIPSDCPQRDERFGWTGDAQIFSETALYHADCAAFFAKYLYDMREEQRRYAGACPFIVPDGFSAYEEKRAGEKKKDEIAENVNRVSAAWGDAAVVIPWNLYRFTGDVYSLGKNYENMRLWTDFLFSADENVGGGKRLWNFGFQFGDWLALDADKRKDRDGRRGATDESYIASAYYYNAAKTTAKAARVLGKTEDAIKYEKLAEEILSAIKSEYATSDGGLTVETQTSYALAAIFGFIDGKKAGRELVRLVKENGGKLSTGFVGTAFLLDALTKTGNAETAYTLMLGEDYPGWLYEVKCGATTVWERWNSLRENGEICDTEMNSLNHYAYGAAAAWIYKTVCGINVKEGYEGFEKAEIRPVPDKRLGSVFGEYRSGFGVYSCGYEQTDSDVRFEITVPYLGEAEFFVPEGCSALDNRGKKRTERTLFFKGGKHIVNCIKNPRAG